VLIKLNEQVPDKLADTTWTYPNGMSG